MQTKPLNEITTAIQAQSFSPDINLIVGVARGGMVPAFLVATHLGQPLELMWLNLRDDNHDKQRPEPVLTKPLQFDPAGKHILIVDDRANSGATLQAARELLAGAASIQTLAINGPADYSLFDGDCFKMPWNLA